MAKNKKGATSKPIVASGQTPEANQTDAGIQPAAGSSAPPAETTEQKPAVTTTPAGQAPTGNVADNAVTPAKKSNYDAVKAKQYRDRIKAAAIAGGHVFKEKGAGTGTTVKKTSKTGTTYYYQPWSQLSQEQKDARLASARKRNADDRALAAKYKLEHPELFPAKGGASDGAASDNG